MKQLVCLDAKQRFSNRNDEYYYEITMFDFNTEQTLKTYISDNNRNSTQWAKVINLLDADEDMAPLIAGKLPFKNVDKQLINADGEFSYMGHLKRSEVLDHIHDIMNLE